MPAIRGQRVIADKGEHRDGREAFVVLLRGVLGALVGRHRFWAAVAIKVCQEDADVGAAVARLRQDEARPCGGAGMFAWVLEVDEVRELGGHHDVQMAIAVHVSQSRILRCRGLGALGQGDVRPNMRAGRAEGDAHMAIGLPVVGDVRFMHGHDVLEPVAVEVSHLQAVAAAEVHAAQSRVVNQVFAPTDEGAVRGLRGGGRVADWRAGRGFAEGAKGERHGGDDASCGGFVLHAAHPNAGRAVAAWAPTG